MPRVCPFYPAGSGEALVNQDVAECINQLRIKRNEFCHAKSLTLNDKDFEEKCDDLFEILKKIFSDVRKERNLFAGEIENYGDVEAITDEEVAKFKGEIEELQVRG